MKGKHAKTLDAVFADPVRANVLWSDVETLFRALGARSARVADPAFESV